MRQGNYPQPWATVAEVKARRKDAEANRREAVHRQQVAQRVRHEEVQRQSQEEQSRQQARASGMVRGIARHKEEEAPMQARSADMQIHRARQEEQEAKRQLAEQRRKVTAQPAAETAAAGMKAQAQQQSGKQHQSQLLQAVRRQQQAMEQAKHMLQRQHLACSHGDVPHSEDNLQQQATRGPLYPAWDEDSTAETALHRKAKKREKHNGLSPLQPEVNMIDMSLNSPCLAIPCLANTRLMEQA